MWDGSPKGYSKDYYQKTKKFQREDGYSTHLSWVYAQNHGHGGSTLITINLTYARNPSGWRRFPCDMDF